jgi:hypothetical protein
VSDLAGRVRDHLLFLREIGVEALDLSRPAPRAAAPPGRAQASRESTEEPDGAAASPRHEGEAQAALDRLRAEEIGDCRRCKLHAGRRTIVFG